MLSPSEFEALKAGGQLPSPSAVAIRVTQLTRKDEVTIQEVAQAIKADPAMSGRIVKLANAKTAYQSRPIVSVVDAVSMLGFNAVRQLVLSLSLMNGNLKGACPDFDYQYFWSRSLLTAITAQNLVAHRGIGSSEELFVLGLLGQIGALALASARPREYSRILAALALNADTEPAALERAEFGFDHNQLTQAMLADWGMPQVFQEVALYCEQPGQAGFAEGSRGWHLLNVLHIADLFSSLCLSQEPQRRKIAPNLILTASRLGLELDALAGLGDQSVQEWREWCKPCGIRSLELPPFAELLAAVPLAPAMIDIDDAMPHGARTFYELRILLVDDDKAIVLLVKKILEKAGHTVATAGNGLEGLEMIEAFKPQLIITDWIMPRMDGIEFCKSLRRNPAWRNIYVFIMTGQEGMDRLVEGFEAGANDYMTKPINPKLLLARLRAAQRVVQLQEEMEFDHQQLHKFADELAAFNQRLRRSEVYTRAILENSPYMTWLKDPEGRYLKVNKAFVEYARRWDIQQIVGKSD